MQNVLEQGPDFWWWFNKTHIVFTQYMHAKMFSIQMLLYTFQSNCAKGLHFSAFHYYCCYYYCCCYYYYYYCYYYYIGTQARMDSDLHGLTNGKKTGSPVDSSKQCEGMNTITRCVAVPLNHKYSNLREHKRSLTSC